jgi:actin related protein 2/3 complex subunit 5
MSAFDNDNEEKSDSQLLSELKLRENEVNQLLLKKDKIKALKISLQSPPISTKSSDIKNANCDIIEKVLISLTESEIATIITGLDEDESDILMKYVYKILGKEKATNCAIILKIHGVLTEKAGMGCIVRSLCDRKTV